MNWKKIWFGILVIGLPLTMLAASIRWYNDAGIPQKTTMVGTEIVSLQQTGPNAYRWALLSDVRTYMGGSGVNPVVNIYATTINVQTNYITNAFITLLTVNSNAYFYNTNFVKYEYVTNLFVTTNFVNYEYVTNLYATTEYVTNLYATTNFNTYNFSTNLTVLNTFNVESNAYFFETNFNNYEITTNLLVTENITVQSNLTVNNNITAKTAYITNLFTQTAQIFTNSWAGPTNTIDLSMGDQNFTATTDMDLTGVTSKSNAVVQNVLLTVVASGADKTIRLTGSFRESAGATSYVCSNGVPREIWIRYTPALGGSTNCCSLSFWRP